MNVSKATQVHSVKATSVVFVKHSFVKMEGLAKKTLTNTFVNVLSASPVPTARLSFPFVSHYHATTDIRRELLKEAKLTLAGAVSRAVALEASIADSSL